jgi:hypothetical protein
MNWLRKLTGTSSRVRSSSARRPRSFRPSFDNLEERQVLSASSPAIHAVTDNFGHSEVFFIGKVDHAFYEHDAFGTHRLSGSNTVQSFSAGVDRTGHADAFVTAGDNSVWEWNSSGWHKLYEPERMIELAAVKGDRVYAVGADHALYEYSPPFIIHLPPFGFPIHLGGWQRLDGTGAVQSIDAVTDARGYDAVFAIRGDGTFQERFNGQWQFLSGVNSIQRGFSAGTDLSGNADVFGLDAGQLWRHTTAGWAKLGAPNTVRTISATNAGQVMFITTTGKLDKFDAAGTLHVLDNVSSYLEVSAAASNDVYVTVWDSSGWERTGAGVWHQWSPAGTVL